MTARIPPYIQYSELQQKISIEKLCLLFNIVCEQKETLCFIKFHSLRPLTILFLRFLLHWISVAFVANKDRPIVMYMHDVGDITQMRYSRTSAVYVTANAAISGIDMKIDSPVTEHKHQPTPVRLTVLPSNINNNKIIKRQFVRRRNMWYIIIMILALLQTLSFTSHIKLAIYLGVDFSGSRLIFSRPY